MGREKIKIKKIDDIAARQVTFSKRRQGLFKKARELSILCASEVAVIVFSPAGRLYQYSSSNIKDILNKFNLHLDTPLSERPLVGVQQKNNNEGDSSIRHRSVKDYQQLNSEELQQLEMELVANLNYVRARKRELIMDQEGNVGREQDSEKADTTGIEPGENSHPARAVPGPFAEVNLKGDIFPSYQKTESQAVVTTNQETWVPPPNNVYKVNFSGACFQDLKASGVGIVIRNWRGEFMAALARFVNHPMDVNTTHSIAAKCAIEFAVDYYFTSIELEGDVHNIINGLKMVHHQSWTSTDILPEAYACMRQLCVCRFSCVQKSANSAACLVAQYARNVREERVWLMEEPDFLHDVLHAEIVD